MGIERLVSKDLLPQLVREQDRLGEFEKWYASAGGPPPTPLKASHEIRRLLSLAKTPLLRLVVDTVAQPLFVDGYRNEDGTVPEVWNIWQRNDFDSRQIAVHRDAVKFGYAFATVVPGVTPKGEDMPKMRGVSARRMFAEWEDPAGDDYPVCAVMSLPRGRVRYFDDERIVTLEPSGEEGKLRVIDEVAHTAGVCPVVRYENMIDLDGTCVGEIEPFVEIAQRVNKTTYDRLMVQHFNSWKVFTATGMEPPKNATQEERDRAKLKLRQDDVLIAGQGVTFGQLSETRMDGFLEAIRLDIEELAAVSQTPTNNLTGQMINLSADALAAARAPLTEKIRERQKRFGDSHARLLRLAAAMSGDTDGAEDYNSRVVWRDIETRSLSQSADALGKLVQMLSVPAEAAWALIPGVSQADVEEWKRLYQTTTIVAPGQVPPPGSEAAKLQAQAEADAQAQADTSADAGAPGTPKHAEDYHGGAKRGRRATSLLGRDPRKRRRDGDGDGVVDE